MQSTVLDFWFQALEARLRWKKDPSLDAHIKLRFGELHRKASQGELFDWRKSPEGALAEIIVLDQFSRNIYRDQPAAFASDAQSLVLAQVAIEKGYDQQLSQEQRSFLYMPFMHSESALIHEHAVTLFTQLGIQSSLDFELRHKAIIDRFGRYPHRNRILGRESSDEEIAFLKQPGSSF